LSYTQRLRQRVACCCDVSGRILAGVRRFEPESELSFRCNMHQKGHPMHKPQDIPPVEVPPLDPTPPQDPIPHQNPQ